MVPGFPYPENTALSSHLESVVRTNGAVPATVGVLNGVARVGLSSEELVELTASAGKPHTRKVSRRDLAYIGGMVNLPAIFTNQVGSRLCEGSERGPDARWHNNLWYDGACSFGRD